MQRYNFFVNMSSSAVASLLLSDQANVHGWTLYIALGERHNLKGSEVFISAWGFPKRLLSTFDKT